MTVNELAKALGEAIAEDETYKSYIAAKEKYERNASLQGALMEYNAQRTILGGEFKKDLEMQDADLIAAVKARVDELFRTVTEHPDYIAFAEAQGKLNDMMSKVNSDISFYAFGERPCTHDCSSCHADCKSKQQ